MNQKQVAEYIADGGVKCPHCNSYNLSGEKTEAVSSTTVIQHVRCLRCGKSWDECYTLNSILNEPTEW